MANWKRLLSALVVVFMLLTMPIMTGISRAAADGKTDTAEPMVHRHKWSEPVWTFRFTLADGSKVDVTDGLDPDGNEFDANKAYWIAARSATFTCEGCGETQTKSISGQTYEVVEEDLNATPSIEFSCPVLLNHAEVTFNGQTYATTAQLKLDSEHANAGWFLFCKDDSFGYKDEYRFTEKDENGDYVLEVEDLPLDVEIWVVYAVNCPETNGQGNDLPYYPFGKAGDMAHRLYTTEETSGHVKIYFNPECHDEWKDFYEVGFCYIEKIPDEPEEPIATITIQGESETVLYDGEEHTVIGFHGMIQNELMDKEFTSDHATDTNEHEAEFRGAWIDGNASEYRIVATTADPTKVEAGVYPNTITDVKVYVNDADVTNLFTIVKTDGKLNILAEPIATITIQGESETVLYDGEEHTAIGFHGMIQNELMDKEFTSDHAADTNEHEAVFRGAWIDGNASEYRIVATTADPTKVEAGVYPNTITNVKVYVNDADVTALYSVISDDGMLNIVGETYEDGSLTVTKTNVDGNADDEFTFTLAMTLYTDRSTIDSSTLTRLAAMKQSNGGMFDDDEIQAAIDLLWDYVQNNSSVESVSFSATFTLKGGESITTPSLFGGADYTLTETGVEGYVPSANGETGSLGGSLTVTGTIDGDKTLAFVNTYGEEPSYESGTLTVSKEVVNGDEDLEFNFEVALTFYNDPADPWDSSMVTYINWMMQNSGVFTNEQMQAISQQFYNVVMNGSDPAAEIIVTTTFTLKHGESVEFVGLPGGTDYTITEAGTEGYVASANGQRASIGNPLTVTGTIDGDATVAYKNVVPRVGGGLTISKEVVNGDADQEFNFELTIAFHNDPDNPWTASILSSTYAMLLNSGLFTSEEANAIMTQLAGYVMNAGDAPDPITATTTFTLKHGESKTISSLVGGTEYTITETGTAGYVASANGQTATAGQDLTVTGTIDGDKTVAFVNTYTSPANPLFKTHSIVMSGSIGVNFFLDLSTLTDEEKEAGYMTFDISGRGTITERDNFDPDFMNTSKKYYGFTCYINSVQMADTITATYHYGVNQTKSETYSIKQYLTAIDQYESSFDADMVSLLHALGDYGHYVQPFLAEENGWVIGTDYAEMDKYYTHSYNIDAVREAVAGYEAVRGTNDDIAAVNFTLVMDSETAIKVYFKPADGYTGSFSATIGSGTENVAEPQSDGRYMVVIPNIRAQQLGTTYTITTTTDSGTAVSKISGLSYVHAILNSASYANNTNALNAMGSLYYYYVKAYEYAMAHFN